jgi:hypothetical protein
VAEGKKGRACPDKTQQTSFGLKVHKWASAQLATVKEAVAKKVPRVFVSRLPVLVDTRRVKRSVFIPWPARFQLVALLPTRRPMVVGSCIPEPVWPSKPTYEELLQIMAAAKKARFRTPQNRIILPEPLWSKEYPESPIFGEDEDGNVCYQPLPPGITIHRPGGFRRRQKRRRASPVHRLIRPFQVQHGNIDNDDLFTPSVIPEEIGKAYPEVFDDVLNPRNRYWYWFSKKGGILKFLNPLKCVLSPALRSEDPVFFEDLPGVQVKPEAIVTGMEDEISMLGATGTPVTPSPEKAFHELQFDYRATTDRDLLDDTRDFNDDEVLSGEDILFNLNVPSRPEDQSEIFACPITALFEECDGEDFSGSVFIRHEKHEESTNEPEAVIASSASSGRRVRWADEQRKPLTQEYEYQEPADRWLEIAELHPGDRPTEWTQYYWATEWQNTFPVLRNSDDLPLYLEEHHDKRGRRAQTLTAAFIRRYHAVKRYAARQVAEGVQLIGQLYYGTKEGQIPFSKYCFEDFEGHTVSLRDIGMFDQSGKNTVFVRWTELKPDTVWFNRSMLESDLCPDNFYIRSDITWPSIL